MQLSVQSFQQSCWQEIADSLVDNLLTGYRHSFGSLLTERVCAHSLFTARRVSLLAFTFFGEERPTQSRRVQSDEAFGPASGASESLAVPNHTFVLFCPQRQVTA